MGEEFLEDDKAVPCNKVDDRENQDHHNITIYQNCMKFRCLYSISWQNWDVASYTLVNKGTQPPLYEASR